MNGLPSGTVTFIFTDIEGSTTRWEHQPEAMRAALARHDALLRGAIVEHDGHVVKTMGDAFHAVFVRAPDAVAAALEAQHRLQAETWGEVGPIRVRMAVHTGAAEERDGDYYGPVLNRAARLMGAGHGGQILLSQTTYDLVRDAPPDGATFVDLGEHRLKDLIRPERVLQVVAPDLASDFPPLASLDARPHNLPTHPTALLGRERELADVRRLFQDGARLVTLTGPGGTGKTRLSLQVAAELLDASEHGVFFVELAPITDPALVPSAIAQVLGVRDACNRPVVEALKEFFHRKRLLLVLDNFEQVVSSAPIVADLLAASPGLAALVTSREPLRVRGEREYAVPPLEVLSLRQPTPLEAMSRNAAVALFVERAVAVRSDFVLTTANAGAVAGICARLDGLPLAIELAAARVRLLSPEVVLARLDRRLPLLTGGARDLPARQRTLRDTIAWSHDLLTGSEQRLFRRLSVFVGGCTLEAAEAVCISGDRLETDILDELASLVTKSLLREVDGPNGEPRFAMLETIREYGLEQLEASGEATDLRQRHLTWFLELAEWFDRRHLGSSTETAAQDVLDADLDNVRAALLWSEDPSSDLDLGLRLAGAAREFWTFKGYLREGRAWVTRLLAHSTARTVGRADALHTAGYLALRQGDYEPASGLLEEALAIWRELDDSYEIAVTLRSLGQLSQHLRDYERARAFLEESLSLNRQIDHPRETNLVLRILADLALERAEYSEAAAAYEQCLPLAQRRGDVHEIAYTLRGLGNIARAQGEYARGRELLLDSLRLLATLGDQRCTPFCLEGLACTEIGADWAERATRLLGAAHALQETTGSPAPPIELADYQRTEADARAQLGEEQFAAVWAAGAAMSFDEAVAYALAESTSAPMPDTGPTDVPLSAREREVVALIAAGQSNGEIAQLLTLGVATVEQHIGEIYNRLGISGEAGRAILTAYARRHRLVELA